MKRATVVLVLTFGLFAGCSTAKKKTPELARMEGKKVALVTVEGETTPRSIVEVALVNQLMQKGSFILVSKQDVEAAKAAPEQDPRDWKGIAKKAGADYALKAKVLKFDGTTREGYSAVEEEDSQLAAERGKDEAKTQRYYKVKSLEGNVQVFLEFTDLASGDTRSAVAEKRETVTAEAKDSGADLPPKLRFLEKLANEAFRQFFEQYN